MLLSEGRWRLLSEGRRREGAVATELGWLDGSRSGNRGIEGVYKLVCGGKLTF